MTETPAIAFQNGEWVQHESVAISLGDLGFRQGVTAVERLRTYGGKLFHPERHLERWLQTIEHLHLKDAIEGPRILDLASELLDRNQTFVSNRQDVSMVWLLTPGVGGVASPTLILHLQVLDAEKCERWVKSGQPLLVTDVQQPSGKVWPRHIKVRSRLHYYLADMQARQMQTDASGILVDEDGSVTETSVSNLAILHEGQIVSPEPAQVLPGVTQGVVEHIARRLGLTWRYHRLFPRDLRESSGVLLMGTDVGLWFASSIDGKNVADGGDLRVRLRREFEISAGPSPSDTGAIGWGRG